jgi:hypothetical protein
MWGQTMSDRASRVQKLADAVKDYTKKEKTRIENEVKVLEAILKGRTGGAGVQASSNKVVEAVAKNDLKSYLEG